MRRKDCVRKCDNTPLQEKDCIGCKRVRRVGDKVAFESSYLGKVLATVDAKGGLYVIDAIDYSAQDGDEEV